jgi:hypothetical protein
LWVEDQYLWANLEFWVLLQDLLSLWRLAIRVMNLSAGSLVRHEFLAEKLRMLVAVRRPKARPKCRQNWRRSRRRPRPDFWALGGWPIWHHMTPLSQKKANIGGKHGQ